MASKHEVEAIFRLKDEMSVQLEAIRKKAAALEKEAKGLISTTGRTQSVFKELSTGLDRVHPRLGATASRISDLTSGLSPFAAGLTLAGAGVVALGGFAISATKELAAMGDRLTNLSRVTTISTDGLQRMEAFGRPLGITLEQMTTASTKLEKALGEGGKGVTKALKDLGLSAQALSRMDADDRLLAVARAAATVKDPLQQARISSELLGRAWADLRLDAASIEEGNEAIRNSIIATNEALTAGDKLGDAWSQLWANMKTAAAEGAKDIAESSSGLAKFLNDVVLSVSNTNKESERQALIVQETARLMKADPRSSTGFTTSEQLNLQQQAARNVDAFLTVKAAQAKADAEILKNLGKTLDVEKDVTEEVEKGKKAQEDWNKLLDSAIPIVRDWSFQYGEIAKIAQDIGRTTPLDFIPNAGGSRFGGIGAGAPGAAPGINLVSSRVLPEISNDLSNIETTTEMIEKAQREYNEALSVAADLANLIGGSIGQIVGQTFGAASALANLAKVGGIKGAFSVGKDDATGFLGFLGGVGGIVSAIGPLVGPALAGIQALFKLGGPDIGRDVGRDIGVSISEGLEQAIEDSGQNAQLFLSEIFEEGSLDVNRFAEEVGDLFSFFERGEISKNTLISELREDLPILIEHFGELGASGEEQIQRILGAAESLGLEMSEISALVQKGFAPETMEDIAETFSITNDQVRELAASLGVNLQTDLERMAASLGLSTEEMTALAAVVEEKFKIPIEQIDELIASFGVNADQFAASLGVATAGNTNVLGAEGALDPNAIGGSVAINLMPGLRDNANAIVEGINSGLGRLADRIVDGLRDAVAQAG